MCKSELVEEVERVRARAKQLLISSDNEQRRLKLLISKYHQCLKDHDLTDTEIAEFVQIDQSELVQEDCIDSDEDRLNTTQNSVRSVQETEQGSI